MLLKSLEIQGFKSFPDKTVLSFSKGITAVLGPNGSGKSNISDAVRWVLGEQSTKSLRSGKMEDVIFNGTAARKAQGFAEVTIVIDNSDHRLQIEGDEVAVTRRYYRSGESEYLINRTTVRLRDVNELFMDTGLGRDGYSMISQGKIGDIVAAKSDERRDIFEEAAGISRYRYRKAEAERKLERTEDNLLRLNDIMAELTARVGPLETQSKKAQEFLVLSAEKKELEIGLFLNTLSRSKDLIREQERKISLAETQYDEINKKTSYNELRIEALTSEGAKLLDEADKIRKDAFAFEEEAARNDGEIAVEQNNIFHNEETAQRIEEEINTLLGSDSTLDNEIESRNSLINEKNQNIASLKNELEISLSELEELLKGAGSEDAKLETVNRLLSEIAEKISLCNVAIASAESKNAEIVSRKDSIDDAINAKNEALEKELNELELLKKDLDKCEETVVSCLNSKKGYEMRLESRKQRANELKEEMNRALLDAEAKRKQVQILTDLDKNLDGFSGSVKAVMKEKDSKGLRGIHGTVSQLISVDSNFAAAIETALGNKMQNIIVSTDEDAKRAIRYLKERNLGRATFIPVDTAKPQLLTEKGMDAVEGFVGVAADLVSSDAQYSDIVYSLLGKIVVCEDLDCAVIMAKKYGYRFRIVTLDGQVVHTGGSMTGGSISKNAEIFSRRAKIDEAEKAAERLQQKAEEIKIQAEKAAKELAETEGQLLSLNGELTTANEDKIRILGEIRRVGDSAEGIRLAVNELKSEKTDSAEKIAENENIIKEKNTELASLFEEQANANGELERINGAQNEFALKRESITERNSQIRLDILGIEKEITAIKDAVNMLLSQKKDAADKTEELKRRKDQLTAANELILAKIEQMKKHSEFLRERSKGSSGEIDAVNQKRLENEAQIEKLRAEDKELTARREQLSNEATRLSERREALVKENDEVIVKLFDEYQLTRTEAEELGIEIEDIPAASKRVNELKSKIRSLGNVNVAAIEEYKEVSERYEFMKEQISDVNDAKKELLRLIAELTGYMKETFTEKFEKINRGFTSTFTDLFGGGTAQLKLSDPDNILESGIEIIVQPPGKKVSSIEQLSGGEKTLVSLAVYFAIMHVAPPPFCILDEVEAALDDVNVDRYAGYLRRMTEGTQFIAITHRRGTMEEADVLYGVTMQEKGVSKLLKLDVREIEKNLQLAN